MSTTTVHKAKTNLSSLIRESLKGKEVIIARGKIPVVKLVPVKQRSKRVLGTSPGFVKFIADDFDKTPSEFNEYL